MYYTFNENTAFDKQNHNNNNNNYYYLAVIQTEKYW